MGNRWKKPGRCKLVRHGRRCAAGVDRGCTAKATDRHGCNLLRAFRLVELQFGSPVFGAGVSLFEALGDGVVLCQLCNVFSPGISTYEEGPRKQERPTSTQAATATGRIGWTLQRVNVEAFLMAARKLGVPESSLFTVSDLTQGIGMEQVTPAPSPTMRPEPNIR